MTAATIVSMVITVCGFLVTIGTLSRKMVTKDDIKDIQITLRDLSERNTNVEKKLAVMEYKVEEIQRKVGL